VAVIVGQHIVRLGGIVAGVFKKTWDFFTTVWSSTLKPFISWSWQQMQRLHAWLKSTFDPLLKFLESVRRDILDFYAKWFRPIFDTIDALRSTLRLLELFHVPFARKIDDALAALEARLLRPIRFALEKVNEAINWIDRIVDFDGFFQRLTLVASAWKYERDMWSIWWGSVHRREAENPKTSPATVTPRTAESAASELRARVILNDHSKSALADEYAASLRVYVLRR